MKSTLKPPVEYSHRYLVPNNKTVPYVFEESELFQSMPSVFATAFMVGLMEWGCMEALRDHMEDGEICLGPNISVTHCSATPPGREVKVLVKCLEVEGSRTKWSIVAKDEKGLIGEGTHERFTINKKSLKKLFQQKNETKNSTVARTIV